MINDNLDLSKDYKRLNMNKQFKIDNMYNNLLECKNDYNIVLKFEVQGYITNVLYPEMRKVICNSDFFDIEIPENFRNDFCRQQILNILKNGDLYAEYMDSIKLRICLCKSYTQMIDSYENNKEVEYLDINSIPTLTYTVDTGSNIIVVSFLVILAIFAIVVVCVALNVVSEFEVAAFISVSVVWIWFAVYSMLA